jgi:uncharacterized protein (TIGR00255 family)
LRGFENDWEKVVREHASRGRVEVSLNLQVARAEVLGLSLNEPMAMAMLNQVGNLAARNGHAYVPDYNRLLTLSSLWQESSSEPDPRLVDSLVRGLRGALEDWNRSREAEGQALGADLLARRATLTDGYARIGAEADRIKADKAQALRDRIEAALAKMSVELSEDRLAQEIVILSDRLDVSEELTRLGTHLALLEKTLRKGGEVGKKVDFLLQETFREINTCGNKAQDSTVGKIVVDFKTELEKCREQVQNIE